MALWCLTSPLRYTSRPAVVPTERVQRQSLLLRISAHHSPRHNHVAILIVLNKVLEHPFQMQDFQPFSCLVSVQNAFYRTNTEWLPCNVTNASGFLPGSSCLHPPHVVTGSFLVTFINVSNRAISGMATISRWILSLSISHLSGTCLCWLESHLLSWSRKWMFLCTFSPDTCGVSLLSPCGLCS